MLVTMKAILDHANEHNYGVMAVNSVNMEMVRAVITAAEEERSPIIVQMGVGQMAKLAHMEDIVPLVKVIAERATVPVALNLDHGGKLEDEIRAMQAGFTNVMIDASSLPYEENVARTKTIVALAHGMGISVEAELGHVGQAADGDGRTDDMYTNVEQAVEFVKETGVDCLAVAIGTAHGLYPSDFEPHLKQDLLSEIKEAVSIPLVLHGGSGNPDSEIAEAVKRGINKINISSDIKASFMKKCREVLEDPQVREPLDIFPACIDAMKETVVHKIHLFQSNDTLKHYSL